MDMSETFTVDVYALPSRIQVSREELDPDTLEHEGLAAAIREAACLRYLEDRGDGFEEIEGRIIGLG